MAKPRLNVARLDKDEQAALLEELLGAGAMATVVEAKKTRAELSMAGEYVEQAQEFVDNMGKTYGITTGFQPFDDLTMGLHGGDLVVLGGQTSHGKSLLANNIAYTMAKDGKPVLFATLEMTKPMTTARFLQLAKEDNVHVEDLPIYYQLANELSYQDIGMLIGNAKNYGCQIAIIDHLHFFPRGQGDNVRNEISRITKHMKEQAVEHDIPVVLLSHVRRLEDKKKNQH
jgi:Replicative DNA helicase